MENIPTKFPRQTIDKMDAMIEAKTYASRSQLVKAAVDRLLNEAQMWAEADRAIEEALLVGRFDDVLEAKIRKIMSQLVANHNNDSK